MKTKFYFHIIFDKPVYNLNIDDYIDYNIDIKNFYNEDIKMILYF